MAERPALHGLSDLELELALRELGRSLAWPAATSGSVAAGWTAAGSAASRAIAPSEGLPPIDDLAARVRRRIVAEGITPSAAPRLRRVLPRPLRSSVGIALAALLILAAIAGAIGLGLPGIRITPTSAPIASFHAPTPAAASPVGSNPGGGPTASPAAGPLGSDLGLGEKVDVSGAGSLVPYPIRLPPSRLGPPETAWLLEGRLSYVWRGSAELPAMPGSAIGLILTQFDGGIEPDYFDKVLGPGTTIETVRIGGVTGYWISGAPHELIFVDAHGEPVFDTRRIVGDTLLWADGAITYRLEAGLPKAAAIELAESLR